MIPQAGAHAVVVGVPALVVQLLHGLKRGQPVQHKAVQAIFNQGLATQPAQRPGHQLPLQGVGRLKAQKRRQRCHAHAINPEVCKVRETALLDREEWHR